MDQESDTKRARFSRWDRVEALLLVPWLAVVVVCVGSYFWWQPTDRTWIVLSVGGPFLVLILLSLGVVAAHAPARPIVRRDSILWRWLRGLGSAIRSSMGLAIGALVGGIVGAGMATARTFDDLAAPISIALVLVGAWVTFAAIAWSIVVAIDLGRLGRSGRVEAARAAFPNSRRGRRGLPQLIADFATPVAAVLWGLVGAFIVTQLSSLAIALLEGA